MRKHKTTVLYAVNMYHIVFI